MTTMRTGRMTVQEMVQAAAAAGLRVDDGGGAVPASEWRPSWDSSERDAVVVVVANESNWTAHSERGDLRPCPWAGGYYRGPEYSYELTA